MDDAPILICYDGSADSDRAIGAAAEVLGPCRAIVVDVGAVLTGAESVAALSSVVPRNAFEDLNMDSALEKARAGAERAREAGFKAEPRAVLTEPIWQGVVDLADEIDAAVIVVGSRGLKWIREQFEGSVSHDVAEHAGRPVLVVPRANKKRCATSAAAVGCFPPASRA
jgi:nucleotide-binding universal stress UspA family protein